MDRNSNSRSHRDTADNDNNLHYSHTIDNNSLQNQTVKDTAIPTLKSFYERILIMDDDTDITLTFKSSLEEYYHGKRFEVYTYNNPLAALSEFKPHFYDLLITLPFALFSCIN
jgi:hypothetical protein